MENRGYSSSSIVIAVILSLVVGGIGGYVIGMQQGEAKGMAQTQAGITAPTNNTTPGVTAMVNNDESVSGTPMSDQMTINLMAQNDSGQSGTAVLSEENGKVKVMLSMTGGTYTEPQPAHIHMGNCPTPGAVLFPLTNIVDGKSETMLDTTMADLKAKGALAINIHKSAAEQSVYTSCGDIK